MHAAAAAALCLLAMRLMPLSAALAVGLLFALHPVHVEAVANVVERAEVLATLFVILSALAYLRYGDLTEEGARLALAGSPPRRRSPRRYWRSAPRNPRSPSPASSW